MLAWLSLLTGEMVENGGTIRIALAIDLCSKIIGIQNRRFHCFAPRDKPGRVLELHVLFIAIDISRYAIMQ